MTAGAPLTASEQLEALELIAGELFDCGYRVLALGSAAVVLHTGQRGTTTKDLDIHVHPSGEFMPLYETIEEMVEQLGGSISLEPDGASLTAHVPLRGKDVTVEIVLGREDFIEPETLEDAVEGAEERDGFLVPSLEHLVAMKAEAWFDRTGEKERKYLKDLRDLEEWLADVDETIEREEVVRLIQMRPERKRMAMRRRIERTFEDRLV